MRSRHFGAVNADLFGLNANPAQVVENTMILLRHKLRELELKYYPPKE